MVALATSAGAAGARLQRPLDPRVPGGPSLSIYYEWYPHTAPGPARGTLVATEGGPGFPTTLSREDYLALFAPLRGDRDVLLMDNRGTGQSGALDCPALQHGRKLTTGLIGECGRSLGDAAYLYSTSLAADDLAAILDVLKIDTIDLYGNSYGTYFEQVFAARHPQKLRSIVLDGAYPLAGPDYAWYPTYAPAMRDKFNLSCRRSEHCSRLAGDSISHIQPALDALRRKPHSATAFNADGVRIDFNADAAALATVMFGAAPRFATLRETDAAARAYAAGDEAPLLRLMADALGSTDSRDPTQDPAQWSSGLAVAVMCADARQIFDMQLPVAQRRRQFEQVLAERRRTHPATYAPFTIDEFRGMPLDYAFIEQCVEWPPPLRTPPHPPSQVVPDDVRYPDVPVLVISGEYDNMTTIADGAAVAAEFPRGRQLIFANSFHVNALPHARSECAAQIVHRFWSTLEVGDSACAAAIPDVRLAGDFHRRAAQVAPATGLPGNSGDADALQCASAAVQTAADVVTRLHSNSSGHGVGLRGGRFTVAASRGPSSVDVALEAVQWTEDLRISGTLSWGGQRGDVVADLTFPAQGRCAAGSLKVRWPEIAVNAQAQIRGFIGAHRILAQMPAP